MTILPSLFFYVCVFLRQKNFYIAKWVYPAKFLSICCRCCPDVVVDVCEYEALDSEERLLEMKRILTEELPNDNYFVLKYIVHFLTEVFVISTLTTAASVINI